MVKIIVNTWKIFGYYFINLKLATVPVCKGHVKFQGDMMYFS